MRKENEYRWKKKWKEKLQTIGTRDLLEMIGIKFITFANDASVTKR